MIVFCFLELCFFTCVLGLSDLYNRNYYWNLFEIDIDGVKYTSDSDYEHKAGSFYAIDELNDYEKFFIQKNVVPYTFVRIIQQYIFSIPRTRPGIPFTLVFFKRDIINNVWSPQLKPYPNSREASKIVSVYGLGSSGCFRLSFVDTGFIDVPGQRKQVQPAQLMVYDALKNKVSFAFEIDKSLLRDGVTSGLRTTFEHLEVNNCSKSFFYINDEYTNDVIVFSLQERLFAKIHRSKHGDEAWTFPVPPNIVHFLKQVIWFSDNTTEAYENYKKFYGERVKSEQNTALMNLDSDLNPKGIIYAVGSNIVYFTNVDRTKLYCWNVLKPLVDENVVLLTQASDDNNFYIVRVDVGGFYFGMMIARLRSNDTQIYDSTKANFDIYLSDYRRLTDNTTCSN